MSCPACLRREDQCRCSSWCDECGCWTNHKTAQHLAAELACPDCGMTTNDGELCGECLSERAEYYTPKEGGSC